MRSTMARREYASMPFVPGKTPYGPANQCLPTNHGRFIETPMTSRPEGPSAGMQQYMATVPLARLGQPDEVRIALGLDRGKSKGADICVGSGRDFVPILTAESIHDWNRHYGRRRIPLCVIGAKSFHALKTSLAWHHPDLREFLSDFLQSPILVDFFTARPRPAARSTLLSTSNSSGMKSIAMSRGV